MWTTDNCCFCCSLRTGSLILGWLQLIGALLRFISDIVVKTQDTNNQISQGAFWSDVVVAVIYFFVATCLLYGIYAKRRQFVLYYVYIEIVVIVLSIISVIITLVTSTDVNIAATIISYLIIWVIQAYWILVVYSLYHEMSSSSDFE